MHPGCLIYSLPEETYEPMHEKTAIRDSDTENVCEEEDLSQNCDDNLL